MPNPSGSMSGLRPVTRSAVSRGPLAGAGKQVLGHHLQRLAHSIAQRQLEGCELGHGTDPDAQVEARHRHLVLFVEDGRDRRACLVEQRQRDRIGLHRIDRQVDAQAPSRAPTRARLAQARRDLAIRKARPARPARRRRMRPRPAGPGCETVAAFRGCAARTTARLPRGGLAARRGCTRPGASCAACSTRSSRSSTAPAEIAKDSGFGRLASIEVASSST